MSWRKIIFIYLSKKLAIAYGLMNTPLEAPICVIKYLLVDYKKKKQSTLECAVIAIELEITFEGHKQVDTCYCKVEFNQPSCWFYSVPNLLYFSN